MPSPLKVGDAHAVVAPAFARRVVGLASKHAAARIEEDADPDDPGRGELGEIELTVAVEVARREAQKRLRIRINRGRRERAVAGVEK